MKDYIPKANEQLHNNSFYQKPNADATVKHSKNVKSAIENLRKQELYHILLVANENYFPRYHIMKNN